MGAAGIVLTGGRSVRMGRPKATLDWHGSTLVRRTVGVLERCLPGPLVVVRAPGQDLPTLPGKVEIIDDPVADQGPLQGIAAGLAAVNGRAEVAFVVSTDLPFLDPAFVRRVLELDDGSDVLLPEIRGFPQYLAAAYRPAVAVAAAALLDEGERRLGALVDRCATRTITTLELLADPVLGLLDPQLDSVLGVNDDEAYRAALERPAPRVEVRTPQGSTTVHAATAGGAAAAVGADFDGPVEVDGVRYARDWAEVPLLAGDTVTLG